MGANPAKVHFPNLNSIRFIAAFAVIIHHIEQIKIFFGLPNHFEGAIVSMGKLGVTLFFVLSGFLITYLLFAEKGNTGTVSVKYFYIRRILRIWPLYYLITILAFLIFPHIPILKFPFDTPHFWTDFTLYLVLLPTLVRTGEVPFAAHLWSIGVEEQFYLFWPWIVKKVTNKWVMLLGVIILYLGVKYSYPYIVPRNRYTIIFYNFLSGMVIDCMAIGGLYALIIYERTALTNKIRKIIFMPVVQWITLIAVAVLIYINFIPRYLHEEFYAVMFGLLLCNFAENPRRIFSLEHKWLSELGNISYGLYMYHPVCIALVLQALLCLNIYNSIVLYILSVAFSIVVAGLSYKYFEKFFINKKKLFEKVLT